MGIITIRAATVAGQNQPVLGMQLELWPRRHLRVQFVLYSSNAILLENPATSSESLKAPSIHLLSNSPNNEYFTFYSTNPTLLFAVFQCERNVAVASNHEAIHHGFAFV